MHVEVFAEVAAPVAEAVALQDLRRAERAATEEDALGLDVDLAGCAVLAVENLAGETFDHPFFDAQVAGADFTVDVGAVLDGRRQEVLVDRAFAADGAAELAHAAADAARCIAGDEVAVEAQLLGAALEDERVVPRDLGADLLHVERSFDLVEQRRELFGSPG